MFFSIGSGGDECEVVEDSRVPSRSEASPELVPSNLMCRHCEFFRFHSDDDSCESVVSVGTGSVLASGDTEMCLFRSAISVSLSCASPFLNVSVFIQPKMAAGSGKGWQSWDTSSSSWDEHVWEGKKVARSGS